MLVVLVFYIRGAPVEGCCDYIFDTGRIYDNNVTLQGDARVNDFWFDLNNETASGVNTTYEPCGRVMYNDRVRMVDKGSGMVASFNTSLFGFDPSNSDGLVGSRMDWPSLSYEILRSQTSNCPERRACAPSTLEMSLPPIARLL